jgi:antitoxin component YwqK of YwqJK toxin-antitoxin module
MVTYLNNIEKGKQFEWYENGNIKYYDNPQNNDDVKIVEGEVIDAFDENNLDDEFKS